jgi:cellulose synthase/poly-beta-1,6-N-acetylglucosamine synthase-like glycosyltransferase
VTQPLVSVVMPVHNAQQFLQGAITSILGQTHARLELVIVDDGSTDASFEIARECAARDPRVRLFQNDRNLGIVATRNHAFARADATSKYFAIMDADDVSLADRLERQVAFLEAHADHALVGGNTIIIDERGVEIGRRSYPSGHDRIVGVMGRYNPIAQPTVMLRKSVLREVGQYRAEYPRCEDYDLWMRIAARFKVANLDAFTLKYRLSANQQKSTHLKDLLRYTLRIQRQWLFVDPFFRPLNVLFWLVEHALLPLPEPIVLQLFKALTYTGPRTSPR